MSEKPEEKVPSTSGSSLSHLPTEQPSFQVDADPENAASPPSGPNPHDYPDGGWEAWLVVAGGFCTVFASFGWINCEHIQSST